MIKGTNYKTIILSKEKTIFFYMQKTRKKLCLWKIFYGDVVNLGLEDRIVEI